MQYTHATYLRIFVHGHVALFKKKNVFVNLVLLSDLKNKNIQTKCS